MRQLFASNLRYFNQNELPVSFVWRMVATPISRVGSLGRELVLEIVFRRFILFMISRIVDLCNTVPWRDKICEGNSFKLQTLFFSFK